LYNGTVHKSHSQTHLSWRWVVHLGGGGGGGGGGVGGGGGGASAILKVAKLEPASGGGLLRWAPTRQWASIAIAPGIPC